MLHGKTTMQNPGRLAALWVLPGITGPSPASLVNIDLALYDSSGIKKFIHIKGSLKMSVYYILYCVLPLWLTAFEINTQNVL